MIACSAGNANRHRRSPHVYLFRWRSAKTALRRSATLCRKARRHVPLSRADLRSCRQANHHRSPLSHRAGAAHQFPHAQAGRTHPHHHHHSPGLLACALMAPSTRPARTLHCPSTPIQSSTSTPASSSSMRASWPRPAAIWSRPRSATRPATITPACPQNDYRRHRCHRQVRAVVALLSG